MTAITTLTNLIFPAISFFSNAREFSPTLDQGGNDEQNGGRWVHNLLGWSTLNFEQT